MTSFTQITTKRGLQESSSQERHYFNRHLMQITHTTIAMMISKFTRTHSANSSRKGSTARTPHAQLILGEHMLPPKSSHFAALSLTAIKHLSFHSHNTKKLCYKKAL